MGFFLCSKDDESDLFFKIKHNILLQANNLLLFQNWIFLCLRHLLHYTSV